MAAAAHFIERLSRDLTGAPLPNLIARASPPLTPVVSEVFKNFPSNTDAEANTVEQSVTVLAPKAKQELDADTEQ